MRIAGIFLRDFEPFLDQLVEFPEKPQAGLAEVHFLVGQNGTGKTRILSLLAAACGNPFELDYRTRKTASAVAIDNTIAGYKRVFSVTLPREGWAKSDYSLKGLYTQYLTTKASHDASLQTQIAPERFLVLAFRSIPALEDQPLKAMGDVKLADNRSFLEFTYHAIESKQICLALTIMKLRVGIADGNPMDRTVRMVNAFDETIRRITDRDLHLSVGYVNNTFQLQAKLGDKEIQLKQLPDGLRAIIGWLASCMVKLDLFYPDADNPLEQPVFLLLDEPDAHLHPAWQRKLIPAVQKLLPNAQIFIATHSPFVVSSVNHGWIHIFEADDKGMVKIKEPQACNLGDSYIDVVEDILGVREQFDPETEELLRTFRAKREEFKTQPPDKSRLDEVITLAKKIGERSQTLAFMMGREVAQIHSQYPTVG